MLSGISISLLVILFLAIVGWAYDGRRQASYREAALLPLQADAERTPLP